MKILQTVKNLNKILLCLIFLVGCTTVDHKNMFKYHGTVCVKRSEIKANCYKGHDIIPLFEVTLVEGRWIISDVYK